PGNDRETAEDFARTRRFAEDRRTAQGDGQTKLSSGRVFVSKKRSIQKSGTLSLPRRSHPRGLRFDFAIKRGHADAQHFRRFLPRVAGLFDRLFDVSAL